MASGVDFSPKLSPWFIVYLRDYLLDRDVDPNAIFSASGVDSVTESESALPIPTRTVIELCNQASERCSDPLLGFNMARHYHYECSALLIIGMLAAPNVHDALTTLSFFDKYVDTGITTSYEFTQRPAFFSANLLGVDGSETDHLNDYLVTFVVHTLNVATRKQVPVTGLDLQHTRTVGAEQIETFFNAPVRYGQTQNTIYFENQFLQEPLLTSNALLYEIIQKALRTYFSTDVRENGFIESVCRELMRQSEIQTTDLNNVAEALSLSERTLRRRLKDEGFTFQQVKSMARERQTKYYLANTNMPLTEIAYALGYAETSSFSRAFKQWTSTTPQEYRDTARKLISA